MSLAIGKLKEHYPNNIVSNISQFPELYYTLSNEAHERNLSLQKYLSNEGFAYGKDATILKLEEDIEESISALNQRVISAALLNENHIYSGVFRLSSFYGISIKEYIEHLGYEYIRNIVNESNIDYKTAKRLKEDFNFTFLEIGDIVGLSRQRIEQILKNDKKTLNSWETTDFLDVLDTFKYMIKNHIFETCINETRFLIRNNKSKEICLIWYDENSQHCAFSHSVPAELKVLIEDEKMNLFCIEDYHVSEEIQVVNILKKPYIKIENVKLFNKACRKHQMNADEYAKFLGYSGYVTKNIVNTDRKIIRFLEENLIDGEVYISSDPSNHWIKNFISRSGMSIDEFVEFYGYKKAGRGKFATLESYITSEKEKLRKELDLIAVDGLVQPQGNLYQRLNIFSKKLSISMNELISELGFVRKRERIVDKISLSEKLIRNDLEELERDISIALKYEKNSSVLVERNFNTIVRNMNLVTRLKKIYSCKCQLCSNDEWMPIQEADDTFYCEVHHIIPLAEGMDEETTLDVLLNMIVVCPNHHKALHFHKGGFRNIVEENGKLFFLNDSEEKLEIIVNYHLKSNQ